MLLAALAVVPVTALTGSCSLSVATIPQGGEVAVDGNVTGTSPLTDIPVSCGMHTIDVQKSGYAAYTTNVTVAEGRHQDVIANLRQLADRGDVTIRSEPPGGDLYIDGKARGTTGITVNNLVPGRHEVLIKKTGYEDYRDVISVSPEITTEFTEYLVPLPGTGFLSVTSFPEGADVLVDGKAAGKTPTLHTRVTSGNHTIELGKVGYWNFTGIVTVTGGESLLAKADLSPVPTTCTLYLDSTPAGAGIYLNGTFKGFAPETLDTLPAGDYRLEFRFPGNASLNQLFAFSPGSTHEILASFDNTTGGSILDREWEYQNQSSRTSQPGWIQVNATPVIERTFNWTASGHEARITLAIPQDLYQYYQKQPHPTNMTKSTLAAYAISERDREYLHVLVKRLKDASGYTSYNARNDYRNVVAFVQGVEYRSDGGSGQANEYWKYPIETLGDGSGDCEDTAILAAALLKEMGYDVAVVILPGDFGHAAVAVACENCNGYYYPLDDRKYYYLETAGNE
ncbi:MAG: PEGA domain-containing protein [Methanoregula sp.]